MHNEPSTKYRPFPPVHLSDRQWPDRVLTRALGKFQLKGFEGLVEVHELIGRPEQAEATRAWREAFAEALNNYEQRNLEFAEIGVWSEMR